MKYRADGAMRTYGGRATFGPFYRQAIRCVGRRLERIGAALDSWSWGWKR